MAFFSARLSPEELLSGPSDGYYLGLCCYCRGGSFLGLHDKLTLRELLTAVEESWETLGFIADSALPIKRSAFLHRSKGDRASGAR